jgi:hypothetical protein
MGPSLSTCSETFRNPPNKGHCHTFLVPLPLLLSLPSPAVAKGTLAAIANVAVAISGVHTHPSPVVAKSMMAASAKVAGVCLGVHTPPSPADDKGTLAATAQVAVAVPSPVLAKGPLAAMAKKAVVAPAFGHSSVCVRITTRHRSISAPARQSWLVSIVVSLVVGLRSVLSGSVCASSWRILSCRYRVTPTPCCSHPCCTLVHRCTGQPVIDPMDRSTMRRSGQTRPHKGTHEHIEFLLTEFFDMIRAGQWLVLPYRSVRHLPNLRISPTGVVPQWDQHPCPIVDYTFLEVNNATILQAPDSIQFGAALYHFLQCLERTDTHCGLIKLAKTDISDAFMHVWISLATIPCLGAILLSFPNEEPLITSPTILPMGWVDSPNFLCAITETIADLANARFATNNMSTTNHCLNDTAHTPPDDVAHTPSTFHGTPPPTTCSLGPFKPPLNFTDV